LSSFASHTARASSILNGEHLAGVMMTLANQKNGLTTSTSKLPIYGELAGLYPNDPNILVQHLVRYPIATTAQP
tara:strand:- start:217429 stop:217650 length:222 start_codon:yes stop_codon:yes gene_type:complete